VSAEDSETLRSLAAEMGLDETEVAALLFGTGTPSVPRRE
jgi:hypothetical protein